MFCDIFKRLQSRNVKQLNDVCFFPKNGEKGGREGGTERDTEEGTCENTLVLQKVTGYTNAHKRKDDYNPQSVLYQNT